MNGVNGTNGMSDTELETALSSIAPLRTSERLHQARTIFISGEINSKLAERVSGQLLVMAEESDEDIKLFIHSPGGHVESGDTIFDMIDFVSPRVKMVGTGWVASAATHIYLAVPVEDRYCLPNTRFMIHQPLGGVGGQASDIEIEAEEMLKARARLNGVIAKQTGQPLEKVEKDTDRNFWMSPSEAVEYGIVGKIIASQSEL
jgi:ATP-dependent Clp protease protease subunit